MPISTSRPARTLSVLVILGAAMLALSACSTRQQPDYVYGTRYDSYYDNRYDSGFNNYSPVSRYDHGSGQVVREAQPPVTAAAPVVPMAPVAPAAPAAPVAPAPLPRSYTGPGGCTSLDAAVAAQSGYGDSAAAAQLRPIDNERTQFLADVLTEALTGVQNAQFMSVEEQADGTVLLRVPSHVLLESSRVINEGFLDVMDRVASVVVRYCQVGVHIVGHTDSSGDGSYNRTLSLDRANKVRQLLLESLARLGVRDRRVSTAGMGWSQPVASNTSEQGRALNRRVEIFLVPPR